MNDQFDEQIKAALEADKGFDPARSDQVAKEAERMFDEKIRRAKWITWASLALCTMGMLVSAALMWVFDNPKLVLFFAILFLVDFGSTILMKQWYWTVHTRISVQRDIKELQLQIAEVRRLLTEKGAQHS
jgi:hypothetical protein